jgi:hypothetical protein
MVIFTLNAIYELNTESYILIETAIMDIAKSLKEQTELLKSMFGNGSDEEVVLDGSQNDKKNSEDNIYGDILGALDSDVENDLPSELLSILNQAPDSDEFSAPLNPTIAQSFARVPNQLLSKEVLLKFKDSYKVPENCKVIGTPKVNPEIWSSLPNLVKQADARQQFIQQHLSRAIVAQSRLAEQVVELSSSIPKKNSEAILKTVMDTASILGVAMREFNAKRKTNIRPSIQNEYTGICSSKSEVTEYLFGDNLEQSLKAVKSTSKIIKPATSVRGGYRFQPYKTSFQSKFLPSLNYRAPLFQQRGSGYFRGQRFRGTSWRPNYNRFATQQPRSANQ